MSKKKTLDQIAKELDSDIEVLAKQIEQENNEIQKKQSQLLRELDSEIEDLSKNIELENEIIGIEARERVLTRKQDNAVKKLQADARKQQKSLIAGLDRRIAKLQEEMLNSDDFKDDIIDEIMEELNDKLKRVKGQKGDRGLPGPRGEKGDPGDSGGGDFVSLSDTPSSYSGQAGLFPKVNVGEDGLEFVAIAGGGDMLASTYDPTTVSGDAFAMDNMVEGTTTKILTDTERTKLSGIEASADVTDTANVTSAGALMDSEVTNLAQVKAFDTTDYATAAQGTTADSAVQPGDLATVATSGDYNDLSNQPDLSVYDNFEPFTNVGDFPATGDSDVIYLETSTGLMYRWTGSAYEIISAKLALGETSSTAYRGDRGKTAYDHSQLTSGNPHSVTASDVGLGNVDNTSDANKPVSTATQTALDNKLESVVGGTNITIDNTDPLNPTINASGGSTVDVVSNVATNKILGRTTAGSGDSEELTPTQVRTLLNVEDGATADQTAGEIKTAYESNADTNAYTDAEQTKVGHISVTQAVDLDSIETRVNELDASVILMGTWDASVGTFPGGGTAQAGESWIVSVGGTIDSQVFVANDRIVATTDNASTTTYASNWHQLDYTDQVLSVAGKTGAVTLAKADITDFTESDYATGAEGDLASTAVQPGDIDTLAELNAIIGDATLIDTADSRLSDARTPTAHTHTASEITDFDTEVSNNTDVAANTAKVTNATHTGEVTGSGALTLNKTAISNRTDTVITASDTIIFGDATDTNNLKKDTVQGILDLAGGGGGGPSRFDATVGSGGDYADIQAAITGVGGTDIKLLLISDVTEDSDIAVPSGAKLLIHLSNYTLTMGANRFTYTAAAYVTIEGNGVNHSQIDFTPTTASHTLFDNGAYTDNSVEMSNLTFDNNATQSYCYIADEGNQAYYNVRFELPNVQACAIYNASNTNYVFIKSCEFIGGGTSCQDVLYGNLIITTGCYFSGTYKTTNSFHTGGKGVFSNNAYRTTTTMQLVVDDNGIVSGIRRGIQGTFDIKIGGSNAKISDSQLLTGDIDVQGFDDVSISNVSMTGTLDLTDAGCHNVMVTNSQITGAITIGGDMCKFSNCQLGAVTVNSGADDNGFSNCELDTGDTITINSGANRTRVIGCTTDTSISDSGTGSSIIGNTVY